MEKKKFKIKEEMREYIRNVLAREDIPHRFVKEGDQLYCIASLSGERFHKVVKRAYCEKLTDETGILHLTYRESENPNLSSALMKLFGKTSYVIVGEPK